MTRIMAVFGPPNTGKTTFAVNYAKEIYKTHNCHVCVLSADNNIPLLPVLFPTRNESELYSVGEALSKPAPTVEDALLSLTTVKNTSGLCVAGFKRGENPYTYPDFTLKSAENYLDALGEVTDIIIADCTSFKGNVLSEAAIRKSSSVFMIYTPELRCLSWMGSQLPMWPDETLRDYEEINVLSVPYKDVSLPQNEIKAAMGKLEFILPYSQKAKKNLTNGELFASPGKDYEKAIKNICERTV